MTRSSSACSSLAVPSRRRWLASALAFLAAGGTRSQAQAAAVSLPDVKTIFGELLLWASQVALREMHFDHPREDQAAAFKGLGKNAASLLEVAGTKEGHLLLVDEGRQCLEIRTVSPNNEDRGINLRIGVYPLGGKAASWTYPPSAGGEMPPRPHAVIAVATEDAEGDTETRSFHLYQYGCIGGRAVFSGARSLSDFLEIEPTAESCLPVERAAKEAEQSADAARRSLLAKEGQAWSEDASFQSLRRRLLAEGKASPQWSAFPLPQKRSLVIEPFWINDGGRDMVAEWGSPGGVPHPTLFRPLFSLVHGLKYQWDPEAGVFRWGGTVPRPSDLEWFERETGEKA